jgi:hypothetical protein
MEYALGIHEIESRFRDIRPSLVLIPFDVHKTILPQWVRWAKRSKGSAPSGALPLRFAGYRGISVIVVFAAGGGGRLLLGLLND